MKSVKLNNEAEMPIVGLGTWKSKPGEVYQAVRKATELAGDSGEALRSIVELSSENSGQVRDIAHTVTALVESSDAIRDSLENVNRIAQDTIDGMRESSGIVDGLIGQTARLDALIRELKRG